MMVMGSSIHLQMDVPETIIDIEDNTSINIVRQNDNPTVQAPATTMAPNWSKLHISVALESDFTMQSYSLLRSERRREES